jgi:hypothetical protein
MNGETTVVGPCAFRRAWMTGDIDLTGKHGARSRPMRGDWHAILEGCR